MPWTYTHLQLLVCCAITVVEIMVAVILEDRLRHNGVAFAQWRRSVEDLSCGVGDYVWLAILCMLDQSGDSWTNDILHVLSWRFVSAPHMPEVPAIPSAMHAIIFCVVPYLAWSTSSDFGTLKRVTRLT